MNMFQCYLGQVKRNTHMIIAMSPLGEVFRSLIRKFPSLVNCCTIDWFSEWPKDALESVARKFLGDVEMETPVRNSCVQLVQMFHESTA
jgi:dynein heavy chain